MSKNIVLIGMMGVGKTTVGKALASKLSKFSFVDIDEEIVKNAGISINEIFAKFGEPYFRELEKNEVQRLSGLENMIISTGGGIVNYVENMEKLALNGVIIFLQATPETLFSRIKLENTRPLLKVDNPLQRISELLSQREEKYKMADFIISTENKTIDEIVEEIEKIYYDL